MPRGNKPNTDQWKVAENRVADIIGGERVKGNRGEHVEDVSHPVFTVEVKHGKSVPAFCERALDQAQRNGPPGKIPVAVFHRHNSRRYVAMIDLAALAELMRAAGIDTISPNGVDS